MVRLLDTIKPDKLLLGISFTGMPMHNRSHENMSYSGNEGHA